MAKDNIRDLPLQECEFCHKRFREETLVSLGDIDVCAKCNEQWQAEYDACAHEWEPDHHYGRVCAKCGGTDNRKMDTPEPPHA